MPDRPNIVMLVPHDLGTYCGCYGAAVETPHIDALAAEGVRFSNYHCSAAQCSPSRGSISTGLYPHNNGLIGLAHVGWEFNEGVTPLPQRMRGAGYSTHLFGVQHETGRHGDPAARLGYDEAYPVKGRAAEIAGDFAGWLGARSADDGPFFVSLGTREPHRPYPLDGEEVDAPEDVQPLPWLPDREGIRRDIGGLNALTRRLDEGVGVVREAIDASPFADNTLIVMTCDHGIAMPRAKCTCYDPGTRTTKIVRLPDRWDDGSVRDELLINCDTMPTLMELIGAPVEEDIDGRSFLGLLDGTEYRPHEHIFTELTYHGMYNPMRCVRTQTHSYIRNLAELPLVYMPVDIYEGPAGQEMADEYYSRPRPREELYDLQADPLEQHNLSGEADAEDILCDLAGKVDRWMEATGDRLLEGRYPASEDHARYMRERFGDERFDAWMRATMRDWPDMLWFLE